MAGRYGTNRKCTWIFHGLTFADQVERVKGKLAVGNFEIYIAQTKLLQRRHVAKPIPAIQPLAIIVARGDLSMEPSIPCVVAAAA